MLIEPHLERYTFKDCGTCKQQMIVHDELIGDNLDLKYAWFDRSKPFCSECCRDDYVERFSHDHDEKNELFDEEMERLQEILTR